MFNTYAAAVAVEQAAFFEDEDYHQVYHLKELIALTEDEWAFIDAYSMANWYHVSHTLPVILH